MSQHRKRTVSPTAKTIHRKLSDRLLADAAQRNLTAAHQAALMGIERSTLSNIITHKSVPTMDTLVKIADYFGLTAGELLSDLIDEHPSAQTMYLTVSDRIWMHYRELGKLLEAEIGKQP